MPGLWSVGPAVFLFGGFVGGMDVAMNANAVAVRRARRRAIMSLMSRVLGIWAPWRRRRGAFALAGLGETRACALVTLAVRLLVAFVARGAGRRAAHPEGSARAAPVAAFALALSDRASGAVFR